MFVWCLFWCPLDVLFHFNTKYVPEERDRAQQRFIQTKSERRWDSGQTGIDLQFITLRSGRPRWRGTRRSARPRGCLRGHPLTRRRPRGSTRRWDLGDWWDLTRRLALDEGKVEEGDVGGGWEDQATGRGDSVISTYITLHTLWNIIRFINIILPSFSQGLFSAQRRIWSSESEKIRGFK